MGKVKIVTDSCACIPEPLLAEHGIIVASLLRIKPLISMGDGVIVGLGQARSRLGAYQQIVERTVDVAGRQGRIKVAYLHAAALDEVRKLRGLLEKRLRPTETLVAELSPALGVHTGPVTVGLCYLRS